MTSLILGCTILKVPDNPNELADFLQCEVADAGAISGRKVRLISITSYDESDGSPEFVLVEFLDDNSRIEMPLEVLDYVDDIDPELDLSSSLPEVVVRDKESEKQMIQSLAAETIQEAYKRYRECKPAVRSKRLTRDQHLVLAIASDTIKAGFRNCIAGRRSKSKKQGREQMKAEQGDPSIGANPCSPKQNQAQLTQSQSFDTNGALPPGYERRFDESKNRTYYVNHNDKTTSWKHPLSNQTRMSTPSTVPQYPTKDADAVADTNTNVCAISQSGSLSLPDNDSGTHLPPMAAKPTARLRRGSKPTLPPAIARTISPLRTSGTDLLPDSSQFSLPKPAVAAVAPQIVLDHAFSRAFKTECSSITFSLHEVVILLDALEVELLPDAANAIANDNATVKVPALHSAAFASVLTKYAKTVLVEYVKSPQSLEIPESKAAMGVRRIRSLVEGPWLRKAKNLILHFCHSKHGRQARPSMWPNTNIQKLFVALLSFPGAHFSQLCGKDILEMNKCELKDNLGVKPSLLQTRFSVYQHTMQLIEQWWDQGYRPIDELKEGMQSQLVGIAERDSSCGFPQIAPAITPSAMLSKKQGRKRDKQRQFDQANALPASIPTSSKRWGHVEGSVLDSAATLQITLVEVAPLEALLQAWVPLNRAYGWGVPLDLLTALGSKLGGGIGSLVKFPRAPGSDGKVFDAVNGCRWVVFAPAGSSQPLESFSKLSIVRRTVGVDANEDAETSHFFAVLIPLQCLRGAADSLVKLLPHGGALSPDEVVLGKRLKVVDAEALHRAYERFEWWDRPPPDVLEAMAGKRCEVVSVSELNSALRRVGVQMEDTGTFDGIPLEALLLEPAVAPKTKSTRQRSSRSGLQKNKREVAQAWGEPEESDLTMKKGEQKDSAPSMKIAVTVTTTANTQSDAPAQDAKDSVIGNLELKDRRPGSALPVVLSAAAEKRSPHIKVRDRGHSAAKYRGPSSTAIVEAYYLKSLQSDDQNHADSSSRPETDPAEPSRAVPAWMHSSSKLKRDSDRLDIVPPEISLPAPHVTPHSPPSLAYPTAASKKTNFSVAEFDAENAIFDIPVSNGADRKSHRIRSKKRSIPGRTNSDAPVSVPMSPSPQRHMAVFCPQFDSVNAIFDIEPVDPNEPKSRGANVRNSLENEKRGEDVVCTNAPLEPWDDGVEFFVSGGDYKKVQKSLVG